MGPVEIVEDKHLQRPMEGTVFDSMIYDDPGFEYLPFTRRLRAVVEPTGFSLIPRRESGTWFKHYPSQINRMSKYSVENVRMTTVPINRPINNRVFPK